MRGNDITFIAAFGDKDVEVAISSASGGGGSTYHLMFDRFYKGIFVFREDWQVLFQHYTDEYTSAEIETLIAKLTESNSVI